MKRPVMFRTDVGGSVKWGRVYLRLTRRTDERRQTTWAGIGPAATGEGASRRVVGCAVHSGPYLLVVTWRRA